MSERNRQLSGDCPLAGYPDETAEQQVESMSSITIDQLGWTLEEAAAIRASLSAFAADWDHPSMAIYDGL